jgi:hypothetical protein
VTYRPFLPALILLFTAFGGGGATAAPAGSAPSAATTRPAATRPELTPEQRKAAQVRELTRKAVELLRQKKYRDAEGVLVEALVLDPNHSTNVYNMACLKALTNRPDEAVAYLERAADAGFTDFIHIEKDPDLAPLRALPRYKALIAAKDRYQKKEADRAVESLRRQFGEKYLFDLDPETKLIFVANTDAQTLAAVKKHLLAQARSQWEQLFSHKPDQYVAVVLPSLADYKRIIRQPGVEGIYMHGARMLIARRLGQVMAHEFTHALHAGDLDPLGQEHPIWVVEGIASLFEAAQFEGERLVPRDNYRLRYLQAAAKQRTLIPLDKLIGWKQQQFVNNANLGYGQASSVMLYLYERGLLRKFYDAFKADFDKDPSGRHSLEQVTGKALKQFEQDWQAWMAARTPPATDTGPGGAFLGVQFAQENDGLKIEMVAVRGPAESAGIKAGDVVVGMNDLDVRDQQSLMPLLTEFKPGDRVLFKLRRGEEYLTLPLTLGRREVKPSVRK